MIPDCVGPPQPVGTITHANTAAASAGSQRAADMRSKQATNFSPKEILPIPSKTPESLSVDLLIAVTRKNPDTNEIQKLLEAGALPSIVDAENKTPLDYGVENTNPNVLKTLLRYAPKNLPQNILDAALLHACSLGLESYANLLVRSGANPNSFHGDNMQKSPLHVAVYSIGDTGLVQDLFKAGVDIHVKDDSYLKWSALDIAVKKQELLFLLLATPDLTVAKMLMSVGAELTIPVQSTSEEFANALSNHIDPLWQEFLTSNSNAAKLNQIMRTLAQTDSVDHFANNAEELSKLLETMSSEEKYNACLQAVDCYLPCVLLKTTQRCLQKSATNADISSIKNMHLKLSALTMLPHTVAELPIILSAADKVDKKLQRERSAIVNLALHVVSPTRFESASTTKRQKLDAVDHSKIAAFPYCRFELSHRDEMRPLFRHRAQLHLQNPSLSRKIQEAMQPWIK
jgi:hypothetical protein